jgi:hypothetical protein
VEARTIQIGVEALIDLGGGLIVCREQRRRAYARRSQCAAQPPGNVDAMVASWTIDAEQERSFRTLVANDRRSGMEPKPNRFNHFLHGIPDVFGLKQRRFHSLFHSPKMAYALGRTTAHEII